MKKSQLFLLLAAVSLLVYSCGSAGNPLFLQERIDQSTFFKQSCQEQNVTSSYVARADSLHRLSQSYLARDKTAEAFPLLDRAVILYRLALIEQELLTSDQELKENEIALREALIQLSDYEQIRDELKKERGN